MTNPHELAQSNPEIAARAALLGSALGQTVFESMLERHELSDIQPDEAAAIAGVVFGMYPVGYQEDKPTEHTDDEILRTRISCTPTRDDATERDRHLYNFKSELHALCRQGRLKNPTNC